MPDMDMAAISVNLPVLSTVKMPDAMPVDSGQSTGMELKTILANIERKLEAAGLSADAASKQAGHEDAIRNLQRKVAGELTGSITIKVLSDLARVLKCSLEDLVRDQNPIELPPVPGLRQVLVEQRQLIDQQISAIDKAESTPQKTSKRKIR